MAFISALRSSIRTTTTLSLRSAALSSSVSRNSGILGVRWLSEDTRSKIDSAVKAKPVVLFMKGTPDSPQCGFSRAVVQVLDIHGVPREKMQTYNVLEDAELRSGIKEYSDWPTVPQIYLNGEFVGGCDILLGMHQSGELEDVLEKNKIIPPVAPSPTAAATA